MLNELAKSYSFHTPLQHYLFSYVCTYICNYLRTIAIWMDISTKMYKISHKQFLPIHNTKTKISEVILTMYSYCI